MKACSKLKKEVKRVGERRKEKLTDQRESGLQMEAAREGSSGSSVVDAQMLREEDDEQTTLDSLLA